MAGKVKGKAQELLREDAELAQQIEELRKRRKAIRDALRIRLASDGGQKVKKRRVKRTHCDNGHELGPEDHYIRNGYPVEFCRKCRPLTVKPVKSSIFHRGKWSLK